MGRLFKQLWPLLAAAGLFLAVSAVLIEQTRQCVGGEFVYPLDDTYIHMALARNLAHHGIWGVTTHEFSSSSSSLLWTLVLAAAYRVAGQNDLLPLVLNLALGVGLLAEAWHFGRRRFSPVWNFVVLLGIVVLTPLPVLAVVGMEHVLQACAALALLCLAAEKFERPADEQTLGLTTALLLAAAATTAARYEGLFLVFAVCVAALVKRRGKLAVAIAVVSVLPLLAYAAMSLQHGSLWAPNSVLRKGAIPETHSLGGLANLLGLHVGHMLIKGPHLIGLLAGFGGLMLLAVRNRVPHREQFLWPAAMLLLATLLHLNFADIGWFFRYESYLIAMVVFVSAMGLDVLLRYGRQLAGQPGPSLRLSIVLAMAIVVPLSVRSTMAMALTARAATNIYDQHVQMARFIADEYPGSRIALNDIGAVAYSADPKILDLHGLATADVLRVHRSHHLSRERLEQFCRDYGVQIAVVYHFVLEDWGGAPADWRLLAAWTISNNYACGDATVLFYAVGDGEDDRLAASLRRFEHRLPASVHVSHDQPEIGALEPRVLRR